MPDPEFEVTFKLDRNAVAKLSASQDVTEALQIIGGVGERSAKEYAPVDTGTLRRSITHELGKRGVEQYVRIGTNVFYAIFQELGTVKHPAHPFLRPALEDIRTFVRRGG